MSEKFTPGPWYADKYGKIWRNVPSDLYEYGGKIAGDMPLAFVSKGWYEKDETPYPQQANANLIADAWQLPDLRREIKELKAINKEMYEALELAYKNCLGRYGISKDSNECVLYVNKECMIARALRKARGETE